MVLEQIKKSIVLMEDEKVKALVEQALQKYAPQQVLEQSLIAGMKEVGELFKKKEYYVPEVLLASEAFYAGFNLIQPLLRSDIAIKRGTVALGVVHGDIHDIGKNIVKVLIQAAGYRVIDLGNDVPVDAFIETVQNDKPDILGLSSLMTTTMTKMEEIITTLKGKGLRQHVKVIIGGAPVTQEYASKIGADAYGEDASDAVRIIDNLLSG